MSNRRIDITITGNASGLISEAGKAGNAIQKTSNEFRNSVGNTSLATGAMSKYEKETKKTDSTLKSFGEKFRDNRGIIFGIAGMTSALGEAVGMLGMFSDTQLRAQEAQDHLNDLVDQGVTHGKAYNDAMAEVTKQNRFFNMVTRNTILSQMDMIFFTTMVISGLIKLKTESNGAGGILSKLTGIFRMGKTEAGGLSTGLSNVSVEMGKAGKSATALGISLRSALIASGIGAAIVVVGLAVSSLMSYMEQTNKKSEEWTKSLDDLSGGLIQVNSVLAEEFNNTILNSKENMAALTTEFRNMIKEIDDKTTNLNKRSGRFGGLNRNPDADADQKELDSLKEKQNEIIRMENEKVHLIIDNQALLTKQAQTWADEGRVIMQRYYSNIRTAIRDADIGAVLDPETAELTNMFTGLTDKIKEVQLHSANVTGTAQGLLEKFKLLRMSNPSLTFEQFVQAEEEFLQWNPEVTTELNNLYKAEEAIANLSIKNKMALEILRNKQAADLKKEADNIRAAATEFVGYNNAQSMTLEQLARFVPIISSVTKPIHDQFEAIKNNAEAWKFYTDEMLKSDIAQQQFIFSSIKVGEILDITAENQLKYNQAQIAGRQQAQDFFTEIKLGSIQSEQYRKDLIANSGSTLNFVDSTKLLTSEIEMLIENGFGAGTDAAIAYQRAIDHAGESSMGGSLKGLFDAEDSKEFNKAWKELDLGAIPKKLRDDFKEMAEELRPLSESGREASTGLDLVNLSLSGIGKQLSSSKIHETMEKVVKNFKEWAATDWEGTQLVKLPGFLDAITKGTEDFKGTNLKLGEALRDNNIDFDEYLGIIQEYVRESGGVNNLTAEQKKALEDLGIPLDDITGKTAAYTEEQKKIIDNKKLKAAIDAVTGALELQGTYAENLTKIFSQTMADMAQNARDGGNGIRKELFAAFSKVDENIRKLAHNWSVAMNSFIKNAAAAAKGVNQELAKIKDKTVTITYKKVGSPNATGGIYDSFAGGGIVAAPGGHISRAGSPTLFLYGDNTSQQETLAFIPHNEPYKSQVMDKLNSQMGTGQPPVSISGEKGGNTFIINATFELPEIGYHFKKQYRIDQAQLIAGQVG